MQKIIPNLWFDNQAEQAVEFYISVFRDSKVLRKLYYTEEGPGPAGTVVTIDFQIEGQEFTAINGGPHFQFSPAISFLVQVETQDELDAYWDQLLQGGQPEQCGWLRDQFGVSWQIVPLVLAEMLADEDAEKVRRVTRAMLGMVKLDIAGLQQAYDHA